ncbi:hypothetical protein ACHAWT_004815 [Skeletonema menzelii]
MPLTFTSIRALVTRAVSPDDSCSNDNENMEKDGPCRYSPRPEDFIWSWSTDTDPFGAESIGDGSSFSGYDTENGYLREEQWISCISDSEQDFTGSDYLVQEFDFIYEVYTPVDDSADDVLETLDNFERKLSQGVAEALGLVHCTASETELSVARSAGLWLRRSLTSPKNLRFLEEGTTSGILAVSMMPQDEISNSSACTSAVQTDEPSECSQIVGGMTAWVNKADSASSILNDDIFLNAVESYIKDDNSKYLGNGLVHVEYIGEVNTTTYTTRPVSSNSVSSSSGLSSTGILGLALAGVFFVVAGVGGAWFVRKKRNKNDDAVKEKSAVEVKDGDDIQLQKTDEITSFDVEPSKKPPSSAYDLSSINGESLDARTADNQL